MNILIPMAGEGGRFIIGGFDAPKPMIDVLGKPMIQWAVDTLGFKDNNYIFIIKRQHIKYGLKKTLENLYSGCDIIDIDYTTQGAVCTCLLAERFINNDEELLIANCDQIMDWDVNAFIKFKAGQEKYDGIVVTYYANTDKNSYVKLDSKGIALEFAEKKVISNESLNGIHYWRKGKDFVESAKAMIDIDDRVNNEFYIAPTYNHMIKAGKKITAWHIDSKCHNAIGTPADLYYYINRKCLYENI